MKIFLLLIAIITSCFGANQFDPADPRHQFIIKVRNNFSREIAYRKESIKTEYESVALLFLARERLEQREFNPANTSPIDPLQPDWGQVINHVMCGWGYEGGLLTHVTANESDTKVLKAAYTFRALQLCKREEAEIITTKDIFSVNPIVWRSNTLHTDALNEITRKACILHGKIVVKDILDFITPGYTAEKARYEAEQIQKAIAIGNAMFEQLRRGINAKLNQDPQHCCVTSHGVMQITSSYSQSAAAKAPGLSFTHTSSIPQFNTNYSAITVDRINCFPAAIPIAIGVTRAVVYAVKNAKPIYATIKKANARNLYKAIKGGTDVSKLSNPPAQPAKAATGGPDEDPNDKDGKKKYTNLNNNDRVTEDEALTEAERFLGKGYKEVSKDRYLSADGKRQFRMGDSDLAGGDPWTKQEPHVHFEDVSINPRNGKPMVRPEGNRHIYFK